MVRQPHDQFAKRILTDLLDPLGQVRINHEVHGESHYVDLYFSPFDKAQTDLSKLGLLGRIASNPCLLEPFRNSPTKNEVRNCLLKLFSIQSSLQRRQLRQNNKPLLEEELPFLWILATSVTQTLLTSCLAQPEQSTWYSGIYFLGETFKSAIVAINQLPVIPETLFLRILGKGDTQQQAINELFTFPPNSEPLRNYAIELLSMYHIDMKTQENLSEDDQELLMITLPAYLKWREEVLQQGLQQGLQLGLEQGLQQGLQAGKLLERRLLIENILLSRFGTIDEALSPVIEALLPLSPLELSKLLTQLSRDELLAKFIK
jgi:hypothetical protein